MADNEQLVRQAYKIAEDMDMDMDMVAWPAAFTEDGTFTDESAANREADGRAVLRRLRTDRRQD